MNPSTINPLTLPSLPLTERSRLPSCAAIYFALSNEEIFYIGRTTNLRQRWTVHHLLKQLLSKKLVRVAWLECSDTNLLPEIEAALIDYFKPLLNKRFGVANKKLNAIIPDETWEALEEIAKQEMRTKSQMAAILLGEAIAARKAKSPSPDKDKSKDKGAA